MSSSNIHKNLHNQALKEFKSYWKSKRTKHELPVPNEEVQIIAVSKDGFNIQHIKDPTEAVQVAAVSKHEYCLEVIDNPCNLAQLIAIEKDIGTFDYIVDPSEDAINLYNLKLKALGLYVKGVHGD